jgi:DNA invertase Pin-like site-specific DNA recombinase
MPISWGYLRVSTDDQGVGLAAQKNAVLTAGVDERHLFIDEGVSGTKAERPALTALKERMQRGDVVVVAKLDRLGRSVYNVLDLFKQFEERGVELKVLHEQIDTTTPGGKLMRGVLLLIAEFERDMISSRTKSALAEIKRTGIGKAGKPVTIGRPSALSDLQVVEIKEKLRAGVTVTKLAREYGVSRTTIYEKSGLVKQYVENSGVLPTNHQ